MIFGSDLVFTHLDLPNGKIISALAPILRKSSENGPYRVLSKFGCSILNTLNGFLKLLILDSNSTGQGLPNEKKNISLGAIIKKSLFSDFQCQISKTYNKFQKTFIA